MAARPLKRLRRDGAAAAAAPPTAPTSQDEYKGRIAGADFRPSLPFHTDASAVADAAIAAALAGLPRDGRVVWADVEVQGALHYVDAAMAVCPWGTAEPVDTPAAAPPPLADGRYRALTAAEMRAHPPHLVRIPAGSLALWAGIGHGNCGADARLPLLSPLLLRTIPFEKATSEELNRNLCIFGFCIVTGVLSPERCAEIVSAGVADVRRAAPAAAVDLTPLGGKRSLICKCYGIALSTHHQRLRLTPRVRLIFARIYGIKPELLTCKLDAITFAHTAARGVLRYGSFISWAPGAAQHPRVDDAVRKVVALTKAGAPEGYRTMSHDPIGNVGGARAIRSGGGPGHMSNPKAGPKRWTTLTDALLPETVQAMLGKPPLTPADLL